MVKSKEDILNSLKTTLGDNMGDDALGLLEDISDTIDEYEGKTKDSTDWKQKYEENDNAWREKYKNRFFGKVEADEDDENEPEKHKTPMTFDQLFTVKEG